MVTVSLPQAEYNTRYAVTLATMVMLCARCLETVWFPLLMELMRIEPGQFTSQCGLTWSRIDWILQSIRFMCEIVWSSCDAHSWKGLKVLIQTTPEYVHITVQIYELFSLKLIRSCEFYQRLCNYVNKLSQLSQLFYERIFSSELLICSYDLLKSKDLSRLHGLSLGNSFH